MPLYLYEGAGRPDDVYVIEDPAVVTRDRAGVENRVQAYCFPHGACPSAADCGTGLEVRAVVESAGGPPRKRERVR